MVIRRILLALLVLLAAASAALAEEDIFDLARKNYQTLEEDVRSGRVAENWRKVAAEFEKASKGKGDGEALFLSGLCFERASRLSADKADVEKAIERYQRLAKDHSDTQFADNGLFRLARLNENQGQLDKAREFYRKILDKYPKSDMADLARLSVDRVGKERELNALRHWSGGSYTRIVMELSDLTPYEFRFEPADPGKKLPPRIVLELKHTLLSKTCEECREVGDGLVRQVKALQLSRGTARITLDLTAKADFKVFPLLAPARMVIDVYREEPNGNGKAKQNDIVGALIDSAEKAKDVKDALPGAEAAKGSPEKPVKTAKPAEVVKKLKIVIDPGHGGADPGAIGAGGLKEKDITLKMAKAVKERLEKIPNVTVLLTREEDTDMILARRTAFANSNQADLFVSIHANASPYKKARGVETYYLDRASDRAARRVAALENRTDETSVLETEQILADVILNMKLPESRRLADDIQQALIARIAENHGPVRDLGVKKAPFYVLTGAVMPAVLIETAFISNPDEAAWLKDPKYQATVADAIASVLTKHTAVH